MTEDAEVVYQHMCPKETVKANIMTKKKYPMFDIQFVGYL